MYTVEPLNEKNRPFLPPLSRENIYCMLNIGVEARIKTYYDCTYICTVYSKKSEIKWSRMTEIACSLSGMMSAMLAEGVAHVDQPWEMVIGQWGGQIVI